MAENVDLKSGFAFKVQNSSHKKSHEISLLDPCAENVAEIKAILRKLTHENGLSDTLFMGNYQFLLLEDYLHFQNPLGKIFKDTIVVFKVQPKKLSESFSSCVSELSLEDNEDNDGCPLKLQFDRISQIRTYSLMKQLTENYQLLPLSENVGRQIVNHFVKVNSDDYQSLPVVCICHGKNPKAAVLLGYSKKNNTRLIVNYKGLVSKQEQLPRLSSVKQQHFTGFPPSFTTADASVYAQYDFLKNGDGKSPLTPVKGNYVIMECWWSDVRALLEPLAAGCTCIAKIKAVSGNYLSGAFTLYEEIEFIELLHKSLETGVMSWPTPKHNSHVMEEVKEFIKVQKAIAYKKKKSAPVNSNLEIFDEVVLQNRTNFDFTEKLWMILKDCSSVEELEEAFTFIYSILGEFFVPPYIFPKHTSIIAMDIKKMMETPVSCPIMSPKFTIQLLLEMGVEKLRRDYVTLLHRFVPYESLSCFLEPHLLSLDAITCLKKLHSVLELAIVCMKKLNLSDTLLSEFIRSTLRHYSAVPDIDLSHVFSFQIPAVKARQLLNLMFPTVWELSLVSKMNDFLKQSIHRYVTTPTEEHIPEFLYDEIFDYTKSMLKTASYMYSSATLIQHEFNEKNE